MAHALMMSDATGKLGQEDGIRLTKAAIKMQPTSAANCRAKGYARHGLWSVARIIESQERQMEPCTQGPEGSCLNELEIVML